MTPRPGGRSPTAWILETKLVGCEAASLAGLLDDEERGRLARFTPRADPDTWLVAHVALRLVLGELLGLEPGALSFRRGHHPDARRGAKPWCEQAPWVDFSLSHTRSLACLALATGVLAGVDVEALERGGSPARLVARTTTPEERLSLEREPEGLRDRFLELWTRKEACAKAVGVGLAVPFASFAVDGDGPHPPEALGGSGSSWTCSSLELPAGYVGALATTPATGPPEVRRPGSLDKLTG